MKSATIATVLITLNEESNIARAILSVRSWVDELIVVDMMSDDRTVEIAQSLGAKVYRHARTGFVEPARATAVAYALSDWILILDADEMTSVPLANELIRIARFDVADVCRIPRLNFILGRPMLHGQHAPDRDPQLRFFKKGSLSFSERIHSFPVPGPGTRVLTIPYGGSRAIYHFHAATASELIDKMNRYTTTEARQVQDDGRSPAFWRLLLLPPVFFVRGYFLDQGFRDGWRGFYWACMMTFYRLTREAKHLQNVECGALTPGVAPYASEADRVLREHREAAGPACASEQLQGQR